MPANGAISASRPRLVLPAYWLANLSAKVALAERFTLLARMENLFDEDYELASGYNTMGQQLLRRRCGTNSAEEAALGNRLSKIYTRTGDDGTTGLGDGSRVAKDGPRVEAYGCVDEANSAIGVSSPCQACRSDVPLLPRRSVQHELFDLGGELCIPGHRAIEPRPRLRARARARRVQRAACRRSRNSSCRAAARPPRPATWRARSAGAPSGAPGRSRARRRSRPEPLNYLNRLSDLLFVLARVLARHESGSEVLWKHERRGGSAPAA